MTLYNIIKALERIALTQPNIRTAKDGSVYSILNANPSVKYEAFVVTQNTHRQDERFDYYGLTLFIVDRLDDDLETNRLQVQSITKEQLANIIRTFCNEYDVDLPTITFQTFTERFQDECAGCYAQLEFVIPVEIQCAEEY